MWLCNLTSRFLNVFHQLRFDWHFICYVILLCPSFYSGLMSPDWSISVTNAYLHEPTNPLNVDENTAKFSFCFAGFHKILLHFAPLLDGNLAPVFTFSSSFPPSAVSFTSFFPLSPHTCVSPSPGNRSLTSAQQSEKSGLKR